MTVFLEANSLETLRHNGTTGNGFIDQNNLSEL